jgi:DNA-binding NarL/FixJ family response regulator
MNEAADSIQVAIVEDDRGLSQTLVAMLNRISGIQCVGAFTTAETALLEIPKCSPAVVLMDIHLPGMSGVECVRLLKEILPNTQFVMLTVHDHTHSVFDSLAAGASGFLLKPVRASDLSRALQEVHAGGAPMTPNIARLVVKTFQRPITAKDDARGSMDELSPREVEVLDLLSKGFLQKETHTARIYKKLQVRSRAQAVAKYFGK